jgi:growth factor receptor-binding protein 2
MEAKASYDFDATSPNELSFKKGTILKVINKEDADWYKVEQNGSVGFVPSNYLKMSPDSWFHGRISRVSAEDKLLNCTKEGSFLVRESENSPGGFSLSVRVHNRTGIHVQHFKVLRDDSGKYFLWVIKFSSLNELIAYHTTSSVSREDDIFLKNHILIKEKEVVNVERTKTPEKKKIFVTAQYNFEQQEAGELMFRKNDLIEILKNDDDNWWEGACHGETGIFPASYVK